MKHFLSLSIVMLTLLLPGIAAADGSVSAEIDGVEYIIWYTGYRESAVGEHAIVGCSQKSLSGSVSIQSTVTGTLYWYENDVLCSQSVTAPVRIINYNAFSYNNNITDIYIPESIVSIYWNAFEECTGLTHVTIPASVGTIGTQAFLNCTNLTTITWNAKNCSEPYQSKHLYDPWRDGFWGGCPIKLIIIGEEVESIGNYVFDSGSWLDPDYNGVERVISKAIIPPRIEEYTVPFYYGNCSLSVPIQSLQAYKNAPYWNLFFIRAIGDANDDGNVNIDDATELIDMMLSMNTPENNNADVDGDGRVSIDDVTELIDMMLKGN